MVRRIVPLLLVAALALCGLVGADEPVVPSKEKKDQDEAPLRLKRKKRTDAPPVKDKDDLGEKKGAPPRPEKDRPGAKKDDRLQPEDGPPDNEEEDRELIERIARNMRAVEEKLGNREIGERTQQQQRDILDDLDRLLKKSQQQQNQDQQNQDQQNADQQPQPQGGQQKQRQQQMRQQQQKKGGAGKQGKQRQRRQLRHERGQQPQQKQQQGKEKQGLEKQGPEPEPKNGDRPGAGGSGKTTDRDLTADLYKDIWGHLPESLRAEMNAYSNPAPFLPRYDRVISEYYKTIARQGRKKGD